MKHIVIDLEMNTLDKKFKDERIICGSEIIQIGAVLLDEQYQEIGSFNTLVKPQYNERIERKFERLTGITTEMVQNAPVFSEAIGQFLSWCRSIRDDIQIYQWSESDYEQIAKELVLKRICLDPEDRELLKGFQDFQKEYGETLGLSKAVSLKDAVMYAGVDFSGKEHDALDDAKNTASLLRIIRIPELCNMALENVIDAFQTKPIGTSLGDLLHFDELGIPA